MPGKVKRGGAEALNGEALKGTWAQPATDGCVYTLLACRCVPIDARATDTPPFEGQWVRHHLLNRPPVYTRTLRLMQDILRICHLA